MKKIHRTNIRTVLLGIVLPLWLLSFLFGRNSVAVVEVASSQALSSNRSGEQQAAERRDAMDLNVDGLVRRKFKAPKADPFALYVPKPRTLPLAPPPPPPAPTAPALPFAFLGRMVESDNTATNMVVRRLGGSEALNQRMRQWGLQQTLQRQPLPDGVHGARGYISR